MTRPTCPNCGRRARRLFLSKAHGATHCGCYWDRSRSPARYFDDEPRPPTGTGLIGMAGVVPAGLIFDSCAERLRKFWQPRDLPIAAKPDGDPMYDREIDAP